MTQTYIPREYGGTGLTLEQLDALPPAERNAILVATIDTLRERIADLRSQLAEAEAMIREQMRAAGAHLLEAGSYEVKLVEKTRWEYDTEGLVQLPDAVELTDRQHAIFTAAVKQTISVNKTELNKLSKFGGDIAELIDQCSWKKLIGFDLELRRLV